MNLPAVLDHITDMEGGYRPRVYPDSLGKRTIGIGFNLDDPTAPETCTIHGLDWQKLVDGNATIGYSDAVAICTDQILVAKYAASSIIPKFDALPETTVQVVVLDMEFNLGHPHFSKFFETIAAINRGDFAAAAADMKASLWYQEVGRRGVADCQLMASAVAAVTA